MDSLEPAMLIGPAGFLIGFAFGIASQLSGFCTMGALSDVVYLDDWRRFRSWMLALAVALAGTQALHAAGVVDLGRSVWLDGQTSWGGAVLGGVMFGIGMTLAGGCGAKTLVRLGGGNLKALVVVLATGLFAMMTLRGVLAPLRLELERLTALGTVPAVPVLLFDAGVPVAARVLPVVLVGGLAWWCLKSREFRRSPADLFSGLATGLLVAAGWAATGLLGADPFEPVAPTSLSYSAPIGGAVTYLMTYTGATLSFGVAAVAGTVAGAFAAALAGRRWRVEGFADTRDLVRHLGGAALMGCGGVLALGCTIGQGLTGVSTLSPLSLLALLAVTAGGVLNLKWLEEGSLRGALRSLVRRPTTDHGGHPPAGTGCSG